MKHIEWPFTLRRPQWYPRSLLGVLVLAFFKVVWLAVVSRYFFFVLLCYCVFIGRLFLRLRDLLNIFSSLVKGHFWSFCFLACLTMSYYLYSNCHLHTKLLCFCYCYILMASVRPQIITKLRATWSPEFGTFSRRPFLNSFWEEETLKKSKICIHKYSFLKISLLFITVHTLTYRMEMTTQINGFLDFIVNC